MSFISDYTFNAQTRIGDDSCDLSQRNMQNAGQATYMLTQYRPDCPMNNAVDFATTTGVNFTGSHQLGLGGCNVDDNSKLHISDLSRDKCRISLFQRPYSTVPYLGRGKSNAVLESQLQQGELANNRKSINPMTEHSFQKYTETPMIPSLKATVSNPANLVEGVAADGWVRGGVPTRELQKDGDYLTNHTAKQYV